MRTTDPDMSTEHCKTLRRVIALKRFEIEEIDRQLRFSPAGSYSDDEEKPKWLVDKEREREIAQRELEDLLFDFALADCERLDSSPP